MVGSGTAVTASELGRLDLFANLSHEDLESLALGATRERFDRKDTILPVERVHDGIVIISGGARLYRVPRKGIEVTIATLGPGESYLLPVAAPAVQCVCVLEASLDETTIYRLRSRPLHELIAGNLELSARMLTLAAQTVTVLGNRLEDYVVNDVRTRLAHALAAMAAGSGEPISATHQELASLIGTSQTQVTRALASLRRAGLVASERHRRGIIVRDRDQLARYGGSPG
jgi:CRP-like cAMP-binding protein